MPRPPALPLRPRRLRRQLRRFRLLMAAVAGLLLRSAPGALATLAAVSATALLIAGAGPGFTAGLGDEAMALLGARWELVADACTPGEAMFWWAWPVLE